MDRKQLYIYGGIGAVVLVGGFLLLRGGGTASNTASDTSGAYYPPLVYGGATGTVTADGSLPATSTDSSINAILAQNLATATMQNNLSMAQLSNDKDIALAGYTTDLSKTKLQTSATVEASLASQLGNIINNMVAKKSTGSSKSGFLGIGGGSSSNQSQEGLASVTGTIGFNQDTGQISLDIAKNVSAQLAGKTVKIQPLGF